MTREFGKKLQEPRKAHSLTQEQLAEALYVSRTAVSKWESGRGYPSIDSLREVSRFFSVTIDELISPDEVVSAAQAERRSFALGHASLVCSLLDVSTALLLVVPVLGNGTEGPTTVSLLALTGVSPWVRAVFSACVGATVLCGFCELAASLAVGVVGHGLDDETEVSCTGAFLASSALRSILPYSMGYLRSSSQAAAVQYCALDSAADLMVASRHLLYCASAFFSSSYNARFTPVLAFPPSLSQR